MIVKYLVAFILFILMHTITYAQAGSTLPERFDVVASFGSICCGPVDDSFLKTYIKQFDLKHKVAVSVWQKGGCGREGEFKILFSLNNLPASAKKKLLTGLKKLLCDQNYKNKKLKASSGQVSLIYDLPANELTNCRGELTIWK